MEYFLICFGGIISLLFSLIVFIAYRKGLIDGQRLSEKKPLKELATRKAKDKAREPMKEEEYLKFINEYGAEGKK